jgi:hypothetical protein
MFNTAQSTLGILYSNDVKFEPIPEQHLWHSSQVSQACCSRTGGRRRAVLRQGFRYSRLKNIALHGFRLHEYEIVVCENFCSISGCNTEPHRS